MFLVQSIVTIHRSAPPSAQLLEEAVSLPGSSSQLHVRGRGSCHPRSACAVHPDSIIRIFKPGHLWQGSDRSTNGNMHMFVYYRKDLFLEVSYDIL